MRICFILMNMHNVQCNVSLVLHLCICWFWLSGLSQMSWYFNIQVSFFSWSLIANALQKLASVSATPGHTQAFHFFSLTRRAQQTRDILPHEHAASSEAHAMLDAQVCLNALDHTKHFE